MGSSSSTKSSGSLAEERIVVGQIHRPHGLSGELAVEVLSDVPGRLAAGAVLWATPPGRAGSCLTIAATRPHQDRLLVKFAEVADRTAAEALQGATLEVERAAVPPPEAGSYYQFELVGCRCRDRAAGELGEVVDLMAGPGGFLLRVTGPRGELLIPFVTSFLGPIDVAAGSIEVTLPEGFLEACASRS